MKNGIIRDSGTVETITRHVLSLPALPAITVNLLQMVDNPTVSSAQISNLLASDPSMTARVLRLANSPFYGFAHEIKTVQLAITLLGNDTIANLALGMSVMNRFEQKIDDDFDFTCFWEHSLLVATIAEKVATRLRCPNPGSAFTAGILHDIGKLVIHEYLTPAFERIQDLRKTSPIRWADAERQVLDTDHAEIGSWLCRNWHLPDEIVAAVAGHHLLRSDTPPFDLATILNLCDQTVSRLGHEWQPPLSGHQPEEYDIDAFLPFCNQHPNANLSEDALRSMVESQTEHVRALLDFLKAN
jgi:putative nucleotidyltransferase with HDIG domain